MPRPLRRLLPALLVLAAGACASARPSADSSDGSGASPRTASLLAGIGGVDVLVFTDLPDAYTERHGLRSLRVGERVRARLAAAGVPLVPDSVQFDGRRPAFRLELTSLRTGDGELAVWTRVGLGEMVRVPRRTPLPLLVTTWARSGKQVVGDDAAPLWREIDALTDRFIREYLDANPTPAVAR